MSDQIPAIYFNGACLNAIIKGIGGNSLGKFGIGHALATLFVVNNTKIIVHAVGTAQIIPASKDKI